MIDLITINSEYLPDGRPDFASNPTDGPQPTFEEALARATTRSTAGVIASPTLDTPYAYQTSFGVQRQFGDDMSLQLDYVWTAGRHELATRNINLTYDPATGANYAFSDISRRPYAGWGNVNMRFSDGASNYHGLEAAFTKRMSRNFQFSATYSLPGIWEYDELPLAPGCEYPLVAPGVCNVPFTLAPDIAEGDYFLTGAQRHRAVFNGIWQLPYDFQLSGLYFYGDNGKSTTTSGVDVRQTGGGGGRLRPDGTLITRNNFDRPDIHRADVRFQRRFRLPRAMTLDGMVEVFNVFNHANFNSFVINEANAAFGRPTQDTNLAYAPRMVQLGFRLAF
jgi:hypothetical protein